jgi:hypothetical protein
MMLVLLVAVADLRPDAGQPVQGVFIDDDLVAVTPNGQAEKSLLDASFIPGNIDTSRFMRVSAEIDPWNIIGN